MELRIAVVVGIVALAGCGPTALDVRGDSESGTAGGFDDDSSGEAAATTTTPVDGSTSVLPRDTDDDPRDTSNEDETTDTSPDEGTSFIERCEGGELPDGAVAHCSPGSCDLWQQDCAEGQKCVPWSADGTSTPTDTTCAAVVRDPAQPGEPCLAEYSPYSGFDDCDFAAVCAFVDDDTLIGTCMALCTGSQQDPSCPDDSVCTFGNLNLCMETCDPLTGSCADDQTCVPLFDEFVCVPLIEGAAGYAEDCEYLNACAQGLICAGATGLGCEGPGCCTTPCDTTLGDPNPGCPDAASGQSCQPFYEAGEGPTGLETLGICVL